MTKPREIENFVQQFLRFLPEDVSQARQDFEKAAQSALSATLAQMNLVTREEYDIQTELLSNTRAAMDELEKKITALEKTLSDKE